MEGNYYHMTEKGVRAYKQDYRYAGDFKYGIAVVYDREGYAHHIDKIGRLLDCRKYLLPWPYHKNLAVAKDEEGFFHIDKRGVPLYAQRYEWVEPHYNGLALVQEFKGRLGIIDEEGRWIHTVRKEDSSRNGNEKRKKRY